MSAERNYRMTQKVVAYQVQNEPLPKTSKTFT
ncbi:hypothetical protein DFA_08727 [Cavenderia fasciculata]|uniref:Uncharacterized protein n=1 Tax=Cavenderia fasciculata TaxID=261658 RepID=F4Q3X2_CACFS|nr:uncharacterized protein DFA_08727 [Cavenderia fasciculata]EGG17728.1 hypothetical protein DFA_08727 [Cavenderia fasciculata]|eukprot:XP_004356212.1 hypothetical protein DFA_08727 [Cavenderia fasciculata]